VVSLVYMCIWVVNREMSDELQSAYDSYAEPVTVYYDFRSNN